MFRLFLVSSILFISNFSFADDHWQKLKADLKRRPSILMSKTMNRKISRAHKLMSKKGTESLKKAQDILYGITKSRLSYEKSEAYRLLAMSFIQQRKFKRAIRYLKRSMSFNTMNYQQYLSSLLILSQIQLNFKDSKSKQKAQEYLKEWFILSDKPQPKAYALMGYVYYMQDKKEEALAQIKKAISLSKVPRKEWLGVAVNIQLELKRYQAAQALLHQLLTLYPSSQSYWRQKSNVFFNLEKSPEALATYQLAHKVKPFEKGKTLKELSNFLNMQGIPYKSAKNWEKALKEKKAKNTSEHYEYLGDLWNKSEEIQRAINAYHQAIFIPDADPRIFMKLSSLYFLRQEWQKGIDVLKKVLRKKLENKDELYVQVGFAYYYLKEYQKSLSYFHRAEKLRGDSEIIARQWIRQVQQYL